MQTLQKHTILLIAILLWSCVSVLAADKYNGKELDTEDNLNLYDYGARHYDAALCRWNAVDALAEKYASMSPYNYCAGNPVKLVDVDGNEPTEEEAARMSDYVYNVGNPEGNPIRLIGGWKPIDCNIKGVKTIDDDSGLKSQFFSRTIDGQTEYAYAFAGTEDWADVKNDFQQAFGLSEQYYIAMGNAYLVSKNYKDNVTFVGHSLGGGLAAAAAYKTGGRALTFNAAGVSVFTTNTLFTGAKIDAYVQINDELNLLVELN